MLNRRHLRIKVLHAVYAFFQSGNDNLSKGEQELFGAIEKVYDLYIILLSFIPQISDYLDSELELAKQKKLPTQSDLNPNKKLVNNKVIHALRINKELNTKLSNRKILWQNEGDLIRTVYKNVVVSDDYKNYLIKADSFAEDKNIVLTILDKMMLNDELFESYLEEKNIYWHDDFVIAGNAASKSINFLKENSGEFVPLLSLYKDEADDRAFVTQLFRKVILNKEQLTQLIESKTENWETERIALMDMILMQMAIAEMLYFENIPTKVSLNEYIDISKDYSTPKSKVFINGILDKVVDELKRNNKIKKTGRGLIE